MKRLLVGGALLFVLVIGILAFLASRGVSNHDGSVQESGSDGDRVEQIPDAGNAAHRSTGQGSGALPLPDPRLAETQRWERSRDLGPPPDGFATPYVQRESLFQGLFRRHLSDPIELCLDEAERVAPIENYRDLEEVVAIEVGLDDPARLVRFGRGLPSKRIASTPAWSLMSIVLPTRTPSSTTLALL